MTEYDIVKYPDDAAITAPLIQGVMGLDPGWGVSHFGIVVVHFVDGLIRVAYADEHTKSDHNKMLGVVWDLIQKYNVTKVLVDVFEPKVSFRALKLAWGERPDYENVERELRDYMRFEPVSFFGVSKNNFCIMSSFC